MIDESGQRVTHEYQSGIEVLVILLDVVHVVLGRLLLVHGVKVNAGIFGLDGLEESSESILEATSSQRLTTQATQRIRHTTWDRFAVAGTPLRPFQRPP